MAEPGEPEHESIRTKLGTYLHDGLSKGREVSIGGLQKGAGIGIEGLQKGAGIGIEKLLQGKEVGLEILLKEKLKLEHSVGLGPKPNIIPPGPAKIDSDHRTVEIGWHPVPGLGILAEKTGLEKLIDDHIGKLPDPTQHWAVLVGDYVHELWMDEELDIIYINEALDRSGWHTFEVGQTRFTDEALRLAAEMSIHNMREKRPKYNLISNNCQNYALALLDAIQIGKHKEFATSFAVYKAATGAGTIEELFVDKHPEEQKLDDGRPALHRADTLQVAKQVMDENTTKLDNHRSLFR
ncbi:hypothetical protein G7Y89_g8992 [Cudoniella acicularis]|uniref:PPPDE domain-containing protein n=1 Tax=Cudoniella acicularis TaxID=354080 RepID=A0A8H4RJ88_9HELO|nr:hypothetical protein G7Y89_g8992 [Cudoniella acicularis]